MNQFFSQYDQGIRNNDIAILNSRHAQYDPLSKNSGVFQQSPLGIRFNQLEDLGDISYDSTNKKSTSATAQYTRLSSFTSIALICLAAASRCVYSISKKMGHCLALCTKKIGTRKNFFLSLIISFPLFLSAILLREGINPAGMIDISSLHEAPLLSIGSNFSPVETESFSSDVDIPTSTVVVGKGMTLSDLALEYNISLDTLITWNEIQDVRYIRANDTLIVPHRNGVLHTVRNGESVHSISDTYSINRASILDVNNLQSSVIHSGDKLFIPDAKLDPFVLGLALGTSFFTPLRGVLTSDYGYRISPITGNRHFHYGIDIAAASGKPIFSAASGYVAYTENNNSSLGKVVLIKHPQGFQSLYGHLSEIQVKRGDSITRGQVIGLVGNTGLSTGPHLHFTLIHNNRPVNPKEYLRL